MLLFLQMLFLLNLYFHVLYLRLGFSILLEWGHSMYYDNKGDLQTNSDNSLATDFLEGKGKTIYTPGATGNVMVGTTSTTLPLTYEEFLKKITEKRISSNGNYDAMFAKVTNYHWSFLPDGSYDITLDLVSIGDVVESFKINALVDGLTINPNASAIDLSTATNEEIINAYSNKNSIGKFFYNLKNRFGKTGTTITTGNQQGNVSSRAAVLGTTTSTIPSQKTAISDEIITNKIDAISETYSQKVMFYVRLGTLLQFFQEKLIYSIRVENSYSPLLKFDYDVETNLMYVGDLQVSIDPTICVINRTLQIDGNLYPFVPNGEPFESPLPGLGSSYGQIMNIYINMAWILTKLDELKDASSNKTVLIDLLNNMLSSVNGALGGTTALEATIDDTSNTVIIRDKNPLPNTPEVITTLNSKYNNIISDKYAHFDLYGYNNNNGTGSAGFIKEFNFTTEISPELSTMLTIGATANSTVVGENSTAFSKFNIGLKDRFKEEIVYLPPPTQIGGFNTGPITYLTSNTLQQYQANQQQALIDELSLKYVETFKAYKEYLKNLSNRTYNGDADTYKDAVVNYTNYLNQLNQAILTKICQNKNLPLTSILPSFAPGTGFIPFNMSLTMDGLSGMKIYNKFFIDTRYLPTNYPNNAEFLIKNIEHRIENNKWFTTLESVVISKGEADPQVLNTKPNIGAGGSAQNQNPVYQTGPITYPSSNGQNANKLRVALSQLGYTEKGNEIDSGGDIQPNVTNAAISIFNTIKQKYPNLKIKVTSGNDKFHKTVNYNSAHKQGNGLDFTISPSTSSDLTNIENILSLYKINNPAFSFINEYKNLSKAGTAPHFHIQF